MAHRFFVTPAAIDEGEVAFPPAIAHQLRNVLRLRPGAHVVVLDDTGWEYDVELADLGRERAAGHVRAQRWADAEPRLALTLYQSVLKGDRYEWVLQKGTELGVSAFVPVISERTVIADGERIEGRRERWERIIREAAEQSRRGRLPPLTAPLLFPAACRQGGREHELGLIPWEEAALSALEPGSGDPARPARQSLSSVLRRLEARPRSVALFVGPEGGYAPGEIVLAGEHGLKLLTLGPRILRAETAALAAIAVIFSALGEMGG